jgi:hypothetical protein
MKAVCSVCGNVGILEVRGNSQRIVHYRYVDGKRTFTKHLVNIGTDDGNSVGTENPLVNFSSEIRVNLPSFTQQDVSLGS